MEFYNRRGEPITLAEWAALRANLSYVRIADTTMPDGTYISTVWLGVDQQFFTGPVIFETMAFAPARPPTHVLDCDRHTTEVDAVAGHALMVQKFRAQSNGDGE